MEEPWAWAWAWARRLVQEEAAAAAAAAVAVAAAVAAEEEVEQTLPAASGCVVRLVGGLATREAERQLTAHARARAPRAVRSVCQNKD